MPKVPKVKNTHDWSYGFITHAQHLTPTVIRGTQIGEAHWFWPVSFPSAKRLESRVDLNMFIILGGQNTAGIQRECERWQIWASPCMSW